MTRFSLFVVALAATAGAAPQQPGWRGTSNLPPLYAHPAVDHVVVYEARKSWRPEADRITRSRHGALIRSERAGATGAVFDNLATGASVSITRARDAITGVTLWGGEPRTSTQRHRLVATARTETILGEVCRVWRAEPERREVVPYEGCVAGDGVVLRETVLFRGGKVMDEKRAVTVRRRPVPPGDVQPPREALDWSRWSGAPDASARAAGYALTLEKAGGAPGERKLLRSDGRWWSEQEGGADGVASLTLTGPGLRFVFGRRPASRLSIVRTARSAPSVAPGRSASRRGEMVLGERCAWTDGAPALEDHTRDECRTRDGLPLLIEKRSWGSSWSWRATALTRGRTPAGSVRPPPQLLRWSAWGWPELDRR